MKEKNISWLQVLMVSLIVAVVVSLATVSLTGNVIKVSPTTSGTDVYTKYEIDVFLADIRNSIQTSVNNLRFVPDGYYGDSTISDVSLHRFVSSIAIEGDKERSLYLANVSRAFVGNLGAREYVVTKVKPVSTTSTSITIFGSNLNNPGETFTLSNGQSKVLKDGAVFTLVNQGNVQGLRVIYFDLYRF